MVAAEDVAALDLSLAEADHLILERLNFVRQGLPSGGVELIDYKTGRPGRPLEAQSSLQLSIYALGCRDALGLGTPERVTLDFVEHGLRLSAARTDAELDGVRYWLIDRAREVRESGYSPTPSERACGWCDFRAMCPAAVEV